MRQLRYFVQIVESGSLAKASRQLFIAQPALSQQMTRLEDEVGKPLLVRSSKGVTVTDNGDALYHHAKFMLRQLDQAISVARQEHATISGRVALGLAPTTVCQLGLPLMRHLRAKYPGIVLNVIEGLSGHLEQMTRVGQLDLAVLFSQNAASELSVEPLLEEELFVILPEESKLVARHRRELTLHEVIALPLILPSPGHGLRRRISVEFERMNLAVDARGGNRFLAAADARRGRGHGRDDQADGCRSCARRVAPALAVSAHCGGRHEAGQLPVFAAARKAVALRRAGSRRAETRRQAAG